MSESEEKSGIAGPLIFAATVIGTLAFFYWFLIGSGGGAAH